MQQDRVVIQLNLPALERLIGGDSEIELELRHQVVENFAKQHLKPLINDKFIAQIRKEIEEQIKTWVGFQNGYNQVVGKYRNEIREPVRKLVMEAVDEVIKEVAARSFDAIVEKARRDADDRISRYEVKMIGEANQRILKVIAAIDEGIDKRMDAAFEKRINDEIKKRLELATNRLKIAATVFDTHPV